MRQNTAFFFILLILAIIVVSAIALPTNALALGVSTPVLEGNTLGAAEGGNPAQLTISLQNVESQDVLVRVTYSSDADVAKIIDYKETYLLPAGSLDNKITFSITLPETARVNDVYEVRYTVAPLNVQSGGIISLLPGIGKSFKVLVVKNPDKFYLGLYLQETGKIWAVVFLIVVAYVAYSVYKRKKSKHGKRW